MWDDRDEEDHRDPDIFLFPRPKRGPEVPTEFHRKLMRGDTLFFLDAVWQDPITLEVFTVPVTSPQRLPPKNAVPFNLTGCEIWFTAKSAVSDVDFAAIIALNTVTLGGVTILAPAQGTYQVMGPPFNTLTFPDSRVRLYMDTQLKDSTGRVSTIEIGRLTVDPDITRSIV